MMSYKICVKQGGRTIKQYVMDDELLFIDNQLPDLVLADNWLLIKKFIYENELFRIVVMYSDQNYRSEEEDIDLTSDKYSFGIQTNIPSGTFVKDADLQFLECKKLVDWLNTEVLVDIRDVLKKMR